MPVGFYDPDGNEDNPKVRPAWSKPKNKLIERALGCCGRKFFAEKNEYAHWQLIEDKMAGVDDTSFLFRSWVEFCISFYDSLRKKQGAKPFHYLMSYINNQEKQVEWTNKNRDRLLKTRKKISPSLLAQNNIVRAKRFTEAEQDNEEPPL